MADQFQRSLRAHGLPQAKSPPSWGRLGCIEEAARMGLRTGVGSEWVKVLGVKLYADRWLGPRTAALRAPYSDHPEVQYTRAPFPFGILF